MSSQKPFNVAELSEELDRLGYTGLFRLPAWPAQIDNLWSRPEVPDLLVQLISESSLSWLVKFLAAEIILAKQMFLLRPEFYPTLAEVYAKALIENASNFMADWGFLIDANDVGKLGTRFIVFGKNSDPFLKPLLDNAREVPYVYPPDFPSQIRLGLRIKDFAALYLSQIHNISILLTGDQAARDAEIQRLKGILT